VIINSDLGVKDELSTLSSYIKDELNCLDFEVRTDEEHYVIYISEPDHKEIG